MNPTSTHHLTLRDVGEDALLSRILRLMPLPPSPVGPGDDCAVVDLSPTLPDLYLLKTDAIVSGIHFLPEAEPCRVGRKAVARVISDLAAMGGVPSHVLVTIALPPETRLDWVEEMYLGVRDRLMCCGAVLAGGETVSLPSGSAGVISVSGFGSVPRGQLVTRDGAVPGDGIWVTGRLGGSIAGKHLDFQPRLAESRWLVTHHLPHAMMDLSDGLGKDLPRLATASGVGFRIDRGRLPCTPGCSQTQAISDGEDYELLVVLPDMDADGELSLLAAWESEFPGLGLTRIGEITRPGDGDPLCGGWEHFNPPQSG